MQAYSDIISSLPIWSSVEGEKKEFGILFSHALWHAPQRLLSGKSWACGLDWLARIRDTNTPSWFIQHVLNLLQRYETIDTEAILVALHFLSKLPIGRLDCQRPPAFSHREEKLRRLLVDVRTEHQPILFSEALLLMAMNGLTDMKNCDINYPCEKEYKRAVHDFQWAAWFCLGFKSTINIHESSSLLSTLQQCDAASRYLTNIPIVLAKLKTYVWEKELLARKEVNGFKPIDNHPNEDEILSGGAPYFGEIDEEKIGRKDVPVCLAFLDEEDDFTRKSESTYLSSTWISINELPVDLGFLDDDEEEDDDVSDVAEAIIDTAPLALPTSFGVLRQTVEPSHSHPSRILTSTGVLGSPVYPDGINTPPLSTASSTLYESSLQVTPMEGKRLLGGLFDDLHDDWLVDDH